jgi:hypothetical protein
MDDRITDIIENKRLTVYSGEIGYSDKYNSILFKISEIVTFIELMRLMDVMYLITLKNGTIIYTDRLTKDDVGKIKRHVEKMHKD